ncbi:MAG: DUF6177 family protein [Bifidobacteriaceae bacterium]|jgi:hypothetical protein|nr:DUF6177 family protein [Bifidobacteriaceae bacterium]
MTLIWQPSSGQSRFQGATGREVTHTGRPAHGPHQVHLTEDLGAALTDSATPFSVHTETRQALVHLSGARSQFLAMAERQHRRPIVISDGLSALSEPMRQALVAYRGGWAVRGSDGTLRNGLTGRRMEHETEALNLAPVDSVDDMAVNHLRPTPATHTLLQVNLTLRRRGLEARRVGQTAHLLLQAVLDAGPVACGLTEPVLGCPTPKELAYFAGTRQAHRTGVILVGPAQAPAALTIMHSSGPGYSDENLTGLIALAPLGDPSLPDKLARLSSAMTELSYVGEVLFGLFQTQSGTPALATPPSLQHAPTPVAMVLAVGTMKGTRLDGDRAARVFGAQPLGGHGGWLFPLDRTGPATGLALAKTFVTRDRRCPGRF